MFPRLLTLIAGCSLVFSVVAHGAEDGKPVDPDAILAELKAIKEGRNLTLQESLAKAISSIREFASSPSNAERAYQEAYKTVQFEGKPGAASKFTAWKKAQSDAMGTREFQAAVQLHLKYLLLSLQHIADPKNPAKVPAVIAYVNEYAEIDRTLKGGLKTDNEARNLLERPIQEGVFAKAFQVSELLATQKDWEAIPGNLEGILNSGVRNVLLEEKDVRLLETWDLQANLERNSPAVNATEMTQNTFTVVRLPQLQWRKAKSAAALDQKNGALLVMMEIIRQHPNHPDREAWIDQATELALSIKG